MSSKIAFISFPRAFPCLVLLLHGLTVSVFALDIPGVSKYTAPAAFPTSVFSSYYIPPTATQEPQPLLFDPVLNLTYPLNLTDPKTIPTTDTDPVFYPEAIANISNTTAENFVATALLQIQEIIGGAGGVSGNCSKCIAALEIGKLVAQVTPQSVPNALVTLCQSTGFTSNSSCKNTYSAGSFGAIWTQVLAFADVSGLDGRYICSSLSSTFCSAPTTTPLDTTNLFPKPKPINATVPRAPSGKRVKVLHLSDFHLDPRYSVSAEANCSSGLCCRTNVKNALLGSGQISMPAPLYGAFKCDTPYNLGLAALQSIAPLTGNSSFAWAIYTGDLVSHDSQNQLSRAYTEYAELSIYTMFKDYINGAVFPVLGNHDSNPEVGPNLHAVLIWVC